VKAESARSYPGFFIGVMTMKDVRSRKMKARRGKTAQNIRLLVLPPDFSSKIEARRDQELAFKKRSDASIKAAARVETRLFQAVARVVSEMVLYGEADLTKFLDGHPEFRDLVLVKSGFPENTVTVVPSGFDHSIPGTTIPFIMMMVMTPGASP